MWEAFLLINQTIILAILSWSVCRYIKLKNQLSIIITKMNCNDLIDQLVDPPAPDNGYKSQRLQAIAAGGQTLQYLGKSFTVKQIEDMLGSSMTKTLGSAFLQFYALAAGVVLPIRPENQQKLVKDLESDPFIAHALSPMTCEL